SCLLVHYTPTTLIYTLSLHDALPILLYQHRVLYDRAGHFGGIRRHRRLGRAPDGPQRVLPAAARGRVLAGRGAAAGHRGGPAARSEEHTSELQSRENLVCRLLLEKKK